MCKGSGACVAKKKNQKKVITLSPCWNCPPANLDSTRPWFGSCVGDRRRPRRMAGVYHYVATPKMRRESRRRAVGRGGREDFQGCVGQGQFFFFFFFFPGLVSLYYVSFYHLNTFCMGGMKKLGLSSERTRLVACLALENPGNRQSERTLAGVERDPVLHRNPLA